MSLFDTQARLLIFAKAPHPGRVKTRLAETLGAREAARIQRLLLHHVLERLSHSPPCPMELWCAPNSRHRFFRDCRRRYHLTLQRQRGLDLGARMQHAFAVTLRTQRAALLIGSDCPGLTPARLCDALAALARHDAVLTPAHDGGYVLIGLRRPAPALFCHMPWGSKKVLALTRARLKKMGLRWTEQPPLGDIDESGDLGDLARLPTTASGSLRGILSAL